MAKPGIFSVGSSAVAAVGVLATVGATGLLALQLGAQREMDVAHRASVFLDALRTKVSIAEQTIRGVAAYVATSEDVTPREFARYYARAISGTEEAGWRAIAIIARVEADRLAEFGRRMRDEDAAYAAVGYPEFDVFPRTGAEELLPVIMVEPAAAREGVFGFDFASSPERLEAAERALRGGRITVSAPVVLSQDEADAPESLLMVAPVEAEALPASAAPSPREPRLVVASLTISVLMQDILEATAPLAGRATLLRDGREIARTTAGASPSDAWMGEAMTSDLPLSVGAETFTVRYAEPATLDGVEAGTLVGLPILGLLATGLAWAYARSLEQFSATVQSELAAKVSTLRATERKLAEMRRLDALGRLVGGVAHDFNNMLSVVIGNLELLRERDGGDRTDDFAEEALKAAQHGAALTRQLLAYGRKAHLSPRPVDANAAAAAAAAVGERLTGAGAAVKARPSPVSVLAMVDPDHLANALLNLVVNARHATSSGGTVLISCERVALAGDEAARLDLRPGDYIAISVSDDGSGMTPETVARAFEPFFTTKGPTEGSGLGLASVYGFCRQSGGSARIASTSGLGTTVTIHLPAADASVATAERAGPPTAQGLRVMLVEDDPAVAQVLAAQLRSLGAEPRPMADAEAALAALERGETPDLLLTDVETPGPLSGLALARRARELRPDLRIIYVSGYAREAIEGRERLLPDAPLLSKPVSRERLAESLAGG